MPLFLRKGQSLAEYAVLLSVILSALAIMQFYVKRAYQGRIKEEANQVGLQYSPGYTISTSESSTSVSTTTYTGGETEEGEELTDGLSLTKSSTSASFSKEEEVEAFGEELKGDDNDEDEEA